MEQNHVLTWRGADTFASFAPLRGALPDPAVPKTLKGTWFDEAINLRHPKGDALTNEVVALMAAVETRKRQRRPVDETHHRAIVRRILANGLRCLYFRRPSLVAYNRRADGYHGGPAWLSGRAMSRTVDLLAEAGLVDSLLGTWGASSSTYSVTGKLCSVAEACGVTDLNLTASVPLNRLVRLREGASGTPLVGFDYTGDTLRWAARLRDYNTFLAQQDISLSLSPEEEAEWVRHWNEKRKRRWEEEREGCRLYRPELIQTGLYRQFNNGSFQQGGRMYGGWWINTPKTLRPKITINGQPTVELDFSGCAIRMLYHERGLDYQDDPYRLQAVAAYETEKGLPAGHYRECVKAMTQALINDQNGKKPELIPFLTDCPFVPVSSEPKCDG